MDLRSRVLAFVRARKLMKEGDVVLVALSGGVDSFVLLNILQSSYSVKPAHFDHAMRPGSADEAKLVAAICQYRYGLTLHQARSSISLRGETDARTARYKFLDDAMRENACSVCALGHHADDQIETVLFRMMRGTGMRGLAGMPLRRGPYVRPLLPFSKQDIETYAKDNDIEHVEDPTNATIQYARNRIRHVFLPALEAIKPGSKKALLRTARTAARTERAWRTILDMCEADVVSERVDGQYQLMHAGLVALDAETRVRLLRKLLRRFAIVPSRATSGHLDAFIVDGRSGSTMKLGNVSIERAFDKVTISRSRNESTEEVWLAEQQGEVAAVIGHNRVHINWSGAVRKLQLRGFRPGDRIRLAYGTKKLKKLFAEHRIPVSDRTSIPLLVDENGEVLYVHGIARSVDALPTELILNVTVKNAESS